MVEFALILPILVLFLMLALDFGRVFFGWVGLNNAARIAANAAASNATAWKGTGNPTLQNIYRQQVVNDMSAINCRPPSGHPAWLTSDVPDPTFSDFGGTADTHEVGDHSKVVLNCDFSFLTPLVGNILGNPLAISAQAEFTIKGGEIAGIPIGPPPPPPGCVDAVVPNMVGQPLTAARAQWTSAGFTGAFTPATGNDTDIVLTQTTSPASSPNDCLVATATVTVTFSASGCTAPNVKVPNLVGQTVANARTTWTSSGFTGTFNPTTGSDANTVTAQTTNPSASPGTCAPPSTTVTVTHVPPVGSCIMPQLVGMKVNSASTTFTTAGFTGAFTIQRPPNGNYDVTSQSLVGGQTYPCTSAVTVGGQPVP